MWAGYMTDLLSRGAVRSRGDSLGVGNVPHAVSTIYPVPARGQGTGARTLSLAKSLAQAVPAARPAELAAQRLRLHRICHGRHAGRPQVRIGFLAAAPGAADLSSGIRRSPAAPDRAPA